MIYHAMQQPWLILDATSEIFVSTRTMITAICPAGQRHYKLPESKRNVALGGGERNMYDQSDLRLRWWMGRWFASRSTGTGSCAGSGALAPSWRGDQRAARQAVQSGEKVPQRIEEMTRHGVSPTRNKVSEYRPTSVTVAVLTYLPQSEGYYRHRLDVLRLCLESLIQTAADACDLLVFDNGSRPR